MPTSSRRKVLLVGWDAADWKVIHPLMDAGKMPTVKRLVETGAMANLATLHPVLSPMLWTSIATGKRPFKHGIHGFSEPTPDGQNIQPITNLSRKTKAVWNILTQQGLASNVVGWWPSHPAEPIRGTMVSNHFQRAVGPPEQPWPTPPRAVHPERLTETLAGLRLNPNELLAEHILPFIPRAGEIDQDKDRRLASCAKILAECTSVHSVATWLMQNEPWDFMAVYYDAIDHFGHGFMRYHPPRQAHIREEDFDLYHGVVEAGYRYHDMMLHTLLEMAGPETTVLLMSDHGFHPDHLRPKVLPAEPAGPAAEHRDFGIFVLAGPSIKQDAILHGLNLLDITPTLLTLFGLPVGEDMDGHPAVEAFVEPPSVETIPSWDDVAGEAGTHPPDMRLDPAESREAIQQLVALGYIDPPGPDREKAITRTIRELRYNLARAYMDDDRHGEAAEILDELYDAWPNEHRFGVQLALCYRALGRIADLRAVVEDLSTRRKVDAETARGELKTFVQEIRARWKERKQQQVDEDGQKSASARGVDAQVDDDPLAELDEDEYAGLLPEVASPVAEENQKQTTAARRTPLVSSQERRRYRDLRSRANYDPHAIDYLWGYVFLAEGDSQSALERLTSAEQTDADRPGLLLQVGEAYLNLKRPEDAERSFEKAAAIDPHNPHAHLGLCRSYLLRRQNRRAAEAALRTIGLLYAYPLAHYCLGVALHRMGRARKAIESLTIAISINPNFAEAHERLAKIYRKRLGEIDKADEHRRMAREMKLARRKARAKKQQYRAKEVRAADQSQMPADSGHEAAVVPRAKVGVDERREQERQKSSAGVGPAADRITIVSGLPRSGTSMVMQMLAAGGMAIVADDVRNADESNPRGYFEDERVKRLHQDNRWLGAARGKAIKVILQLLPYLPPQYDFRIIVVERDLDEIIASQTKMLRRADRPGAQLSKEQLSSIFRKQLASVQKWLERRPRIEVLTLNHRQIIVNSMKAADDINSFCGGRLDPKLMAATVDVSLYRNRTDRLLTK